MSSRTLLNTQKSLFQTQAQVLRDKANCHVCVLVCVLLDASVCAGVFMCERGRAEVLKTKQVGD